MTRFTVERLRPAELRVLEHVQRLLDGHRIELVGSVCASILLEAITLHHGNHITEIEQSIDDLAETMKSLVRSHLELGDRQAVN